MIRIFWPANHTSGTSWDTVAQLCYREDWDRRMVAVSDGHPPLQTWEEQAAKAMRSIRQDCRPSHSKDGFLLGTTRAA